MANTKGAAAPSTRAGSTDANAKRREGIYAIAHERRIPVEKYIARFVSAADAQAMGFNIK